MNKLMTRIIKWLFVESSARWLFYIITAEYFIAINLSPTILTDYPMLNSMVESMAFIPAVHNFDKTAIHPEAVRFFIALAILLIIPKSMSLYHWLKMNPITELRQYVILPLTDTQPASSDQIVSDAFMTEEEIKQLPTKKRSLTSRIICSILILLLSVGIIIGTLNIGFKSNEIAIDKTYKMVIQGGLLMWFQLSVKSFLLCSLLLAISTIIKDYVTYFHRLLTNILLRNTHE